MYYLNGNFTGKGKEKLMSRHTRGGRRNDTQCHTEGGGGVPKKCHVLFEWSLLCFLEKSFFPLTQPQIVETIFLISNRRSHSPTREMID
jgi:hypothetical protein